MKKNKKNIVPFVLAFAIFFLIPLTTHAMKLIDLSKTRSASNLSTFNGAAGFEENASATQIVAVVIQAFIGLLGVIFVVLIVLAGYNWMTAGGDSGKVEKAKDTIMKAIIGLVIIVAAYSISYFVFSSLDAVVK